MFHNLLKISLHCRLLTDDSCNAVAWKSKKSFLFTKYILRASYGQSTGLVVFSSWVSADWGMSTTVLGHWIRIVGEQEMAVHFYDCEFLQSVEKWHNWVIKCKVQLLIGSSCISNFHNQVSKVRNQTRPMKTTNYSLRSYSRKKCVDFQ